MYRDPELYDRLHRGGVAERAARLERLFALHGRGGRWLEPACGSGLLLEALARPGRRLTGYDAEPRMLAAARRRLRGRGVELVRAELESFERPGAFDFAFCLDGSIRHLLTERAASAHLRRTRRSLAPGGAYVVGLDLCDYARAEDDEELWEAPGVRQLQLCLAPEPGRRRERVLQLVTGRGRVRRFEYELRSYDARQWGALVERSGLRIEAAYDLWDRPVSRLVTGTFVLKADRASSRS